MPTADDIYIHCDELENIPALCRENWEMEIELLAATLPEQARLLQVGCMDGTRIMRILEKRPDLKITGLDLEPSMVERSRKNLHNANLNNTEIVLGDITQPPPLPHFDAVCCLNNTLGYIPNQDAALTHMQRLGTLSLVSVFGEKFTDQLAREYFHSIGLVLNAIENNVFHTKEFVNVLRYTREDVEQWNGKITETPLGYFCAIESPVV